MAWGKNRRYFKWERTNTSGRKKGNKRRQNQKQKRKFEKMKQNF